MPFLVKAFSVKIASPLAAVEATIVQEVIQDWNEDHARPEKIILLPEISPTPPAGGLMGDVLLAFFSTSQEVSSDPQAAVMARQIEHYLQANRPVFIYFSEGRTGLVRANSDQMKILSAYKNRYLSHATIDSFGDEKELRAKFAQQLATMIRAHAYFQSEVVSGKSSLAKTPPSLFTTQLSNLAQALLVEACEDPEAYIGRNKESDSLKLQVNGKQLVDLSQPNAVEKWEGAFHELFSLGLIHDAGHHGRLFQISPSGFKFLESIGRSPIGYIAELGGM